MAQPNKTTLSPYRNLWSPPFEMVNAVTKILIEKGVMSEAEFNKKLLEELRCIRASSTQRCNDEIERATHAPRITRSEAKQLRSVLSIRRGEHGEEARNALHEFMVRWAASHGGKKTKRPQG